MKAFIYGTLKTGRNNNRVLHALGATKISDVTTTEPYPLFVLLDPFPYLQQSPGNGELVSGEMWEIPQTSIHMLDQFEGSPRLYYRAEIDVTDGTETHTVNTYFKSQQLTDTQLEQIPLLKEY